MSSSDIIDLSSDDERIDVKAVKLEPDLIGVTMQQKEDHKVRLPQNQMSKTCDKRVDSEENRSSNVLSTAQSTISVLDQEQSPVNDTSLSSTSPICSAPLCRQFWKAGNYDDGLASNKLSLQNGKNYLHIHPMFLHSNATSHKWAFGAIAELLDNAVDEIQNGATFVNVDKTTNPRDGSPALLIQDDGGGMDPEAIRRCMSFGFSDKKSKSAIGQYGNGFKTSTMRLGADVIVFSRHLDNRTMTQSIGLLSYTFLTRTGHDRILVPMVDYEFSTENSTVEPLYQHGKEHFTSNLSVMLQWSPYSEEAELLKQFEDIGYHGTKVIVYNLWLNDDGKLELDFDMDAEDIRIGGDTKKIDTYPALREVNNQHMGNRFHYSLRVYLSILYLRIPESYRIILRGRDVEHHAIVNDLKFRELIMYRPQSGGCVEGEVITTIGYLKEAPHVIIHGFNIYHKNRLILPFWQVVSCIDGRGRGVVGVLEANFIEPTHDKQDFERTSLFQKLESRLKDMTMEYWDYHCKLIGYQPKKKARAMTNDMSQVTPLSGKQPVILDKSSHAAVGAFSHPAGNNSRSAAQSLCYPVRIKRVEHGRLPEPESVKRQAVVGLNVTNTPHCLKLQHVNSKTQLKDQEAFSLMQENRKLRAQCLEHERRKRELNAKATKLRNELDLYQRKCAQLLAESKSLCTVKKEKYVDNSGIVASKSVSFAPPGFANG